MPEVMTVNEILHWIECAKNDVWYCAEMPVTSITLGLAVGRTDVEIGDYISGRAQYPAIKRDISEAIYAIDSRKIVWGVVAKNKNKSDIFEMVRIYPLPSQRRLRVLAPREFWNIEAQCMGCGGNKWLPVDLNDKPHVACYKCLPPSQYRACGAVASKRGLIKEYVRKTLGLSLEEKECPLSVTTAIPKNVGRRKKTALDISREIRKRVSARDAEARKLSEKRKTV